MVSTKISRSILSLVFWAFLLLLITPSSISAAADDWSDGTGGDIYNNNSADVGIGFTADPEASLHVYGEDGETTLKVEGETEGDNLLVLDGIRPQAFRKFGSGNLSLVDAWNNRSIMKFYRNSDNVEVSNGDLLVPNGKLGLSTSPTNAVLEIGAVSYYKGISVTGSSSGGAAGYFFIGSDQNNKYALHAKSQMGNSDFVVTGAGRVGIGTGSPTQKLTVDGAINAEEIIVEASIADYVFEDDYQMMSLASLEDYIEANGHLPGVTPATNLEGKESVPIGERFTQLLEKIEELTLYTLEQQKEIEELRSLVSSY